VIIVDKVIETVLDEMERDLELFQEEKENAEESWEKDYIDGKIHVLQRYVDFIKSINDAKK
jgi:hypothetical protein